MTHTLLPNIQWDIDLIKRYDKSGPRYTSYPTAVQFNGGFDTRHYQAARDASNHGPMSLYVHIPFCAHVCYYCACNKIITKRKEKAQPYLDALYKEMALRSDGYDKNRPIEQLHWGGGTPTFISHEQMTELMTEMGKHFNLLDTEDRDYSIEIDPRELQPDTLAHLKSIGFNRVSLGVQDFDEKVQKAVNRVQPLEMTRNTLEEARRLGFKSINIDLIYGLPFQTRESFAQTLKTVLELDPDRLSVFNYAHLPERFMPQRRINEADLPSGEQKLGMLEDSIRILTDAGYHYVGMDHFAKPDDSLAQAQIQGKLHRNFQGYTTHEECDLVALGVSSISQIGDAYFQNSADIDEYMNSITDATLPIKRGVILTEEDDLRRAVIKQLICHFNLDFKDIESRFKIQFKQHFKEELHSLTPYIEDGLISLNEDSIQVTDKGGLLIRNICMAFDEYISHPEHKVSYSKVI
ncbi:oxygen-independent coproporphyrinogen III oxidase [Oceaniserpentilla sp. 4NH20-0058]|uniref:oxygen-independent coproporphyrinogen III oxidase n=1 Tax=Oceaniserpentilla sp. 4NH20-0058 TaxID=3127660 RepID=UPI003108E1D7